MNGKDLKNSIPTGYSKIIAQRASVSRRAVSLYLNGKMNSQRIEDCCIAVIKEISDEKEKVLAMQLSNSDLLNHLPYGSITKIANMAGVSTRAVSNFLHGRNRSHKIELATLEVIRIQMENSNQT
jgi:predicted transcriptional regulator